MSTTTPENILQVGMGFWASKTLLTAVNFDVFTVLATSGAQTADQLSQRLGFRAPHARDFFDALVSLGLLTREGDGAMAQYANTEDTATFLDRNQPSYIGGFLEMANDRLYRFWDNLDEGLRTGKAQNEVKDPESPDLFEAVYSDPERLRQFLAAMAALQYGNFLALTRGFDWSNRQVVCDAGGADGALAITLAKAHSHLRCVTFDLPAVETIAEQKIKAAELADRVRFEAGDFFKDPLPTADVITMGNILHDWDLDRKMKLLRSAHDSLNEGGAAIVIENIIDDARRENTFGLLMSLNMLIETGTGFDFTAADLANWAREVGFRDVDVMPLTGPASAVVLHK